MENLKKNFNAFDRSAAVYGNCFCVTRYYEITDSDYSALFMSTQKRVLHSMMAGVGEAIQTNLSERSARARTTMKNLSYITRISHRVVLHLIHDLATSKRITHRETRSEVYRFFSHFTYTYYTIYTNMYIQAQYKLFLTDSVIYIYGVLSKIAAARGTHYTESRQTSVGGFNGFH